MTHGRRLAGAVVALVAVLVVGTLGYVLLGLDLFDALYQTVTTVSTVGFREVEPFGRAEELFTMVLILLGVGAVLYALSVLVETLLEGRLNELLGRRRMEQSIAAMGGHVIICGWGRVGRAIGAELAEAGRPLVVIDPDEAALHGAVHAIAGDATDDDVLRRAGIERAASLPWSTPERRPGPRIRRPGARRHAAGPPARWWPGGSGRGWRSARLAR